MIPLGPYVPDQPSLSAPHLVQALNCVPSSKGYGPFGAFVAATSAIAARARGAAGLYDAGGDVHVFVGDASALYEQQSDATWLDVTRTVGGAYSSAITSRWRFAPFGDQAIATNFDDAVQVRTMSSPTTFADLTGSPPRARHVCTFRDFVFLGYTDNASNEIAWSGINNATQWTAGSNQSDRQILADGGYCSGFAPTSAILLVFQRTKIRAVQYVGPPVIMQIDVLEDELGCAEPGSICQQGRKVFFLGGDGFYMIDNFAPALNIGDGRINAFFLADVNEDYLYRMSAAVDPKRSVAFWCYASTQAVTGNPDTLIAYHWPSRTWAVIKVAVEILFPALGLGYTLDGLDAITSNIDTFDIPLDDPLLSGGAQRLSAFDQTNKFGAFAGANFAATFETGDMELVKGGRAFVGGVRPVVDTRSLTVAVGVREVAGDAVVYAAANPLEQDGMASAMASGRYVRSMITVAQGATWTVAQGLDYQFEQDGES